MQWTTSIIPRDKKGEEFYLDSYKPFRLESLRLDPQAFGSTFARESAFADSQWLQRLHSPAATTFAACDDGNGRVLSSLTLFRMPDPDPDPDPDGDSSSQQKQRQGAAAAAPHWAVNAVWTRPSARRRGIAAAVLAEAIRWARHHDDATAGSGGGGCACVLSAQVYETNEEALALYKKAGFRVAGRQEPEEGRAAICVLRLEADAAAAAAAAAAT